MDVGKPAHQPTDVFRRVLAAPASAPPPRLEVGAVAVLCLTVSPDPTRGEFAVKHTFIPGTVKKVSWDSNLDTRLVNVVSAELTDDEPFQDNWVKEDDINLLKPMLESVNVSIIMRT